MVYFALKYLHLIGAAILLGTGAGIAFFMLMAHRTGEAVQIAAVARIVVVADYRHRAGLARRLLPDGRLDRIVYSALYRDRLLLASRHLDADAHAGLGGSRGEQRPTASTGVSPPVLGLVRVRLFRVCGRPRHPVAYDHAAGLPLIPIGNVSAHFE